MTHRDDPWADLTPPVDDEPFDPLVLPEVKQYVAHERREDALGLRSLLERPEALSRAWWRSQSGRRRVRPAGGAVPRRTLRAA
jgi:hypothetical protein